MRFASAIRRARRFRRDNRPQSAWPVAEIPEVAAALVERDAAIVEFGLVFEHQGEVEDAVPMRTRRHSRAYRRRIERQLGESWSDFVARACDVATDMAPRLLETFAQERDADELELPEVLEVFCHLTWHSEPEWAQHYGENRIELSAGETHEPEAGRDAAGVRYLFQTRGEDPGAGRQLFDRAECLSGALALGPTRERLCSFVRERLAERGDHLPEPPTLDAIALRVLDERVELRAYLREASPDPEAPRHGYWAVTLDAEFAPSSFDGVVASVPR